jgi:hypothetical protein
LLQDVHKKFPHCSSDMDPGQVVPWFILSYGLLCLE